MITVVAVISRTVTKSKILRLIKLCYSHAYQNSLFPKCNFVHPTVSSSESEISYRSFQIPDN